MVLYPVSRVPPSAYRSILFLYVVILLPAYNISQVDAHRFRFVRLPVHLLLFVSGTIRCYSPLDPSGTAGTLSHTPNA